MLLSAEHRVAHFFKHKPGTETSNTISNGSANNSGDGPSNPFREEDAVFGARGKNDTTTQRHNDKTTNDTCRGWNIVKWCM